MSSKEQNEKENRMIAVVSGKGGTGKTVCSLNLASAFHNMGKNVLLVDADVEDPNLGINLGIHSPEMSLNHVLEDKADPEEAVHVHDTGLFVMPSSLSVNYTGTDFQYFSDVMEKQDGYVIADCGPGINEKLISVLEAADSSIVVTNPIRTSISGALRVIELIKEMDTDIEGIVVNNLTSKELHKEEIKGVTGCDILGSIPYDSLIDESITHKRPLLEHSPHSRTSHAFRSIAHNILGEEHEISYTDRLKTACHSFYSFFK